MNVELREWRLSDAPRLAKILNNKKILDNLRDIPFPYSENDAETYIKSLLNAEKDTSYAFAITYGGELVGSIGAFRQTNIHRRTAELGYYVSEKQWGKGICSTAVKKLCEHIFEKTDIIRVFAEPFEHNAASCRVLEKAGFEYEGTLRNAAVKNGKIINMQMYAKLK